MLHKFVAVLEKKNKEKGLFATSEISKGEIVWKLDKGEEVLSQEKRNYLPQEIKKLAFQYMDGYVVVHDGGEYMNHSCDPNLWWNGNDVLIAMEDIQKGEEVTYDYSTADIGDWVAGWTCNCGSKICRKTITGKDCLSTEFQVRFKDHLPTWSERYIKNHGPALES